MTRTAESGPGHGERVLAERTTPAAATRVGWLMGVLLLAVVVLVVTRISEEEELAGLLTEAQPRWLLAAVLLQALTYVCSAAVWQRALARRGRAPRLWPLVPLGVAKLFTDQAVPSAGMSGTFLVVRGLERRGVSRSAAVAAMLTGLASFYLGYLAATVVAVTILWRHGELRPLVLLPAAAFGVLAVGLPLALLVLRRKAVQRPLRRLERWPGARDVADALREAPAGTLLAPGLLIETTLLQLAIFVLDALTLVATLRAVAHPVGAPLVFASFVMASVVSTLSWVPGGLGTFEGSCVALLHLHGTAIAPALAATLLLRGFTFWLPMIPGFALARREAGSPRSRVAEG